MFQLNNPITKLWHLDEILYLDMAYTSEDFKHAGKLHFEIVYKGHTQRAEYDTRLLPTASKPISEIFMADIKKLSIAIDIVHSCIALGLSPSAANIASECEEVITAIQSGIISTAEDIALILKSAKTTSLSKQSRI